MSEIIRQQLRQQATAMRDAFWPEPIELLGGTAPSPAIDMPVKGEYWLSRRIYLQRAAIADGSTLVFGDSLIDGMSLNDIPFAVSMGIGGEAMRNLLNRIADNSAVHRAGAGVILTCVNDVYRERQLVGATMAIDTINSMWDWFFAWATGKWVVVLPLPVDESRPGAAGIYNGDLLPIREHIRYLASSRDEIEIVDATPDLALNGVLREENSIDGLHLNARGQAILKGHIRTKLALLGI